MLENMTTGEKALIGATALGIAALVFHKPTRNAVGLSDRVQNKGSYPNKLLKEFMKKNNIKSEDITIKQIIDSRSAKGSYRMYNIKDNDNAKQHYILVSPKGKIVSRILGK